MHIFKRLIIDSSVTFKITFGVFFIVALSVIIWGHFLFIGEKTLLLEQLDDRGQNITRAAAAFYYVPMSIKDYIGLQKHVEKITGLENDIVIAKIERNDGKIIALYNNTNINLDNNDLIRFYEADIKQTPDAVQTLGTFHLGISMVKTHKILFIRIIEIIYMYLLLIGFIVVCLVVYLNKIISGPLKKLDSFANKLSRGELNATIKNGGRDEFGRLAVTLDGMRKNLKVSYEKILKHRNDLSDKVLKRTESLHQVNQKLKKSNEDLQETQKQIIYLAFHDELTGLDNRKACMDKVNDLIDIMQRSQMSLSVLCIGLDDFTNINDQYGTVVGDKILKETAKRLTEGKRLGDELARWEGDEFILALPDIRNTMKAAIIANQILEKIKEPFIIGGVSIQLTVSIGISLFPQDGMDAEGLIMKSMSALNEAKKAGKCRYQVFDQRIYKKLIYDLEITSELKKSAFNEQFVLNFQPKVDRNKRIVGLEALLRWNSKKYGLIPPGVFIPLVENSNLIIDIGKWVLKNACKYNKRLQDIGYPPLLISVNISPRHFRYTNLVDDIKIALHESGLEPQWLEIEITETETMDDVDESIRIIKQINDLGVNISIDDFGTGYSSFSKLIELTFDVIKIDKSFVDHLLTSINSKITIKSIIELAHLLDKEVVTEGVENEKQFNIIRSLGCDLIQGNYFSKPLSFDDLIDLLSDS